MKSKEKEVKHRKELINKQAKDEIQLKYKESKEKNAKVKPEQPVKRKRLVEKSRSPRPKKSERFLTPTPTE